MNLKWNDYLKFNVKILLCLNFLTRTVKYLNLEERELLCRSMKTVDMNVFQSTWISLSCLLSASAFTLANSHIAM